jgi:hypothetical protein
MSNHEDTPSNPSTQNRRSSFTSQTFNSIFGRSNSTAGGPTAPFPGAISTAAAQDQRRRMSISTLGLSGNSPTQATPFAFGGRRGSTSTDRSDLFDENAIDDDDSPGRGIPTGPFARRMSVGGQAFRARAASTSPGAAGRSPPYSAAPKPNPFLPTIPAGSRNGGGVTPPKLKANQASMQSKSRTASDFPVSARPGEGGGFNWSEQLRSRAESTVSQSQRPSFSASTGAPKTTPMHERTRSLGEMPTPPVSGPAPAPAPAPERPARKKPDAFQERILKGDFYMD